MDSDINPLVCPTKGFQGSMIMEHVLDPSSMLEMKSKYPIDVDTDVKQHLKVINLDSDS